MCVCVCVRVWLERGYGYFLEQHIQRLIYMAQLWRMQYAYDKSRTLVALCKSNLHAYNCRVRHKECCGLLKHVSKPYNNLSDRQF